MAIFGERLFTSIRNALGNDAAKRANGTDDAPSHAPSSSSASFVSAPSDLTSSARRVQPLGERESGVGVVERARKRIPSRRTISEEEKRLTGDFETPADCVYAPDPRTFFIPSQRAAMPKPKSTQAFSPINNLDGVRRGLGQSKPKTYGRHSHTPSLPGYAAFRDHVTKSPATPTRKRPSHNGESSRSAGDLHPKRRRTENSSIPLIIDLSEDDDVQEVTPYKAYTSPAVPQYEPTSSSHFPQRRYSIDSEPTATGSQQVTEFQQVESWAQLMRSRGRIPSKPQAASSPHPLSGSRHASSSRTPSLRQSPNRVNRGKAVIPPESTRKVLLQGFRQGVIDQPSEDYMVLETGEGTTSAFFSKARVNESTSEDKEHTAKVHHQSNRNGGSRTVLKKLNGSMDGNPDASEGLQSESSHGKSVLSSAKAPLVANRGTKRRAGSKEDISKGWPLISARTYGYEVTAAMKNGPSNVLLENRSDGWNIVEYDTNGSLITQKLIPTKDFNSVQADDVCRIRILGPRCQDGNLPTWDLCFALTSDLETFCCEHVPSLIAPREVMRKPDAHMKRLLEKPLTRNEKVGTSHLVNDLNSNTEDHQELGTTSPKNFMHNRMRLPSYNKNAASSSSALPASSRALARAGRSTRSSAPTHDVNEIEINNIEVEKYSIVHGLGTRWRIPLTYGEGRHRASVNFDDLLRLDEEEFLNDNLIDFYMEYLFQQSKIPRNKVFFFNTYFFTQLTNNAGSKLINYKAVERWTSKANIDIFSYDYIVVPINQATHWYLAIICNVRNMERKPIEEDFDVFGQAGAEIGGDQVEQVGSTDVANSVEPQVAEPPQVSTRLEDMAIEQANDDVTLFEEAQLDLIDAESTETGAEPQTTTHNSSAQRSPQREPSPMVQATIDDEAVPRTILSNLNASPQQRKTKRKSMGPKRDPNQPVIIVLDSLGQTRSATVRALKEWVRMEGETRRGMEAIIKEKGLYPKSEQIPTQANWSDCGVYVLGYVEKFLQDPDEFKGKLLTGEMSADADWPELRPKEMRNNLRSIIFDLAKQQKLTEAPEKKKKGKKTMAARKVQATQSVSALANEESRPMTQLETAQLDGAQLGYHVEPVSLSVEHACEVELQISEHPVPRLGSPFSPGEWLQEPKRITRSPDVVGKVSDSPPILVPSVQTDSRLKRETGTRVSPEVRIPMSTRLSPKAVRKTHTVEIKQTTEDRRTGHTAETVTPSKRRRHASYNNELRVPVSKKCGMSSPSIQETHSPRQNPSSPAPQRNGSPDHPIEITDSQDLPTVATHSSQSTHVRKHSPWKIPALHSVPSVEEILPPPPTSRNVKRRYARDDIEHELEARLDAEDRARERGVRHKLPTTSPWRSNDVIDLEAQDTVEETRGAADSVVRETPEL
ncbi:hypothetical protein GQ44DRAFT_722217 [Phaeosphaeriaceae sp. PMI808]|nr:hypothetical protein GQ44DRAFT_722217 [Phaeosphaeriaceae sp. PMI808]